MKKNKIIPIIVIFILMAYFIPIINSTNSSLKNQSYEKEKNLHLENKIELKQDLQKNIIQSNASKKQISLNKTIKEKETSQNKEINTKKNSRKKQAIYINIEKIPIKNTKIIKKQIQEKNKTFENKTLYANSQKSNFSKKKQENKKIAYVFYEKGEKVIEINTSLKNLPEIKKQEKIIKNGKQVIISSQEHLNESLRIYSKLEKEAKKQNIKIYWKNENQFINTGIKYYDENKNGLIDKISWIVPHLSEQIFEIIINSETSETNEQEINITTLISPPPRAINPIKFKFNISYNNISNLNCSLLLKSNNSNILWRNTTVNQTIQINEPLLNGKYFWNYTCYDLINNKSANKTGQFQINETLPEITGKKNMYLLDKQNNVLINPSSINFISDIEKNITLYFKKPSGQQTENYSITTSKSFNINESIISEAGIYTLYLFYKGKNTSFQQDTKKFYVAESKIIIPENTTAGQETSFSINIDASATQKNISYILISYGDGNIINKSNLGSSYIETFKHTYQQARNYTFNILFMINGEPFNIIHQIQVEDNINAPEIELLYPEDEALIKENQINFKFKVKENNKLESCNFSLYNATCIGEWSFCSHNISQKDKVFNHTLTSSELNTLKQGESIKIGLKDFDERTYAWEVECINNFSNYSSEVAYFEVSFSGTSHSNQTNSTAQHYEKEELVKELIQNTTDFIAKENSWDENEKEALNDLGLIEEIKYYQTRLVQIDRDLKYNIKYITNLDLREQRIKELNEEIEKIKNNFPEEFEVIDTYEYVKNGNTLNWEDLLREYFKETNTKTSGSIKNLAKTNKELQNQLSIYVKLKKIKIKYANRTENFILVKKQIKQKPQGYDVLLEVIPKSISQEVAKISFLTKIKEIKTKHIFEINSEKLEKPEIKYKLINPEINLKELEKTDTIIFTGKAKKTGFTSAIIGLTIMDNLDFENFKTSFAFWFLIIIIISAITIFVRKYLKRNKLIENPEVYSIFSLIKSIKLDLQINNLNDAKEKYQKIKELYSALNPDLKIEIMPSIKKTIRAIDKKYIFNLAREYKIAKNNFNKEKAMEIQEKLKKVYFRLKKEKDRQKILKLINGF